MNISALVLYGSCARGDNNSSSDVDLFALTNDEDYRMVVKSKINLAMYPTALALKMAKSGELFMLHIVEEGQPLVDLNGDFQLVKESFSYRDSYTAEISNAGSLGWAIRSCGASVRNQALVNRRIAWCVRTILIAKAAEKKMAIFSASALAEFSNDESVQALILNKNEDTVQPKIFSSLERFLKKWIGPPPLPITADLDAYETLFQSTRNTVGEKTFRAFRGDKAYDEYVDTKRPLSLGRNSVIDKVLRKSSRRS